MLPIWIGERGTNANVLNAARFGAAVRPVKEDVVGDVGHVLWLMMGTIGIVLVIACANFANLLLVRVSDTAALYAKLLAAGVVVRFFGTTGPLAGCLRVTVGTPAENAALLAAL